MRIFFLFISLWGYMQYSCAQSICLVPADSIAYTSEAFQFSDAQGKQTLKGILTIPKEHISSTKVVVLITPSLPISCDYYGFFSTLSDVFGRSGIATLLFDNRAYTDKSLISKDETVTMFDQADDVHQALLALRKDKRFAHQCIGLLGHSEGGAVASIEAARNKDLGFVVCLSALGEKGVDVVYKQTSMPFKIGKVTEDTENELSVLKEYVNIVNEYNSLDSIKMAFQQKGKEYYVSVKDKTKKFGNKSVDEYCQMMIQWYTRPRVMAMIKYSPSPYYSLIACPVLVMHGKMDGNMDCINNLQGIENIFKKNGKKNYEILAVDSVDHDYIKVKHKIPLFIKQRMSHKQDGVKPEYSLETFEYISKWINNIYL